MSGLFSSISCFFNKQVTFPQLKAAVISGDVNFVKFYLSQPKCPLSNPMEDTGYPDEDGYNSTVVNSLLYEAIPHPEVLKILLNDGRFDPNENNKDAFYRCLYEGSIECLQLFYNNKRFSFPQDTLVKAAEVGGKDLIKFLLKLDTLENYQLFSEDTKVEARNIAGLHSDTDIMDMIEKHYQHASYYYPSHP
ncbi:Uncharacterised protein [Legionella busanensis]|uniref:Ankyrin repeats (3 copies) n=1 Tax=Legionella busanensis TaxID=190655 RepID=A0A378JM18_9GAMM|nr:hypothetical protein [Legionella busanensis]STX51738.1 Uncharacterised protein [Legionella busanensis]